MCSSGNSQIKWVALSALSIMSGSCSSLCTNRDVTLYKKGIVKVDEVDPVPGYPLEEFLQFCKVERLNKQQKLYYKCPEFKQRLRAAVKQVGITNGDWRLYRNSESCKLLDGNKNMSFQDYFVGYLPRSDQLLLIEERSWNGPYGCFTEQKEYVGWGCNINKQWANRLEEADQMINEYNNGWPREPAPQEIDSFESRMTLDDLMAVHQKRQRKKKEIQKAKVQAAKKRREARKRQELKKNQETKGVQKPRNHQRKTCHNPEMLKKSTCTTPNIEVRTISLKEHIEEQRLRKIKNNSSKPMPNKK